MLVQIALGLDPYDLAAQYGLDYGEIKDDPVFRVQYNKVETELLREGAITKVIAGAGLHKIVETLAQRVKDPRMPNGDLIKAGEFLKRVKDDGKDVAGASGPQFTIEINFPDGGSTVITAKPKEIVVDDAPELEVDDLPESITHAIRTSNFGVDFDD